MTVPIRNEAEITHNFVPDMKEGGGCPYCGGPTVNVAFEFITCGAAWNRDCFGHQVRTPVKSWSGEEVMARPMSEKTE